METTNIRVHGSRAYWDAVAVLARQHKMTTAAFVKATMESAHGDALKTLASLFATSDANQQHQHHAEPDHA